jgi:hypothetical protein
MNGSNRLIRPAPPAARTGAAIIAIVVLAVGCGSNHSSAGSGGSRNAGGATTPTSGLGYSACMRSHGVPQFPDPTSSGELPKPLVVEARNSNPPRFDAANSACQHLLPAGGRQPTITPADQADYVRAAACMRSHGFPVFPDPTFQDNNVTLNIPSSIDTSSPRFKRAAATCTRLIPHGLPYSTPRGS